MSAKDTTPPGLGNSGGTGSEPASSTEQQVAESGEQMAPPTVDDSGASPEISEAAASANQVAQPMPAVVPVSEVERIHELVRSDPVLRSRLEDRLLDDNKAMNAARSEGKCLLTLFASKCCKKKISMWSHS